MSSNDNVPISKCQYCSKKFAIKSNATRHEVQCSKNPDQALKSYECESCHVKFSRKDNLSVHIHKCHSTNSFKCKFCPLTFSSSFNAQRHVKVCVKNPQRDKQFFSCDLCSKSFSRKDILLKHSRNCKPEQIKKKNVMCLYENCDFQCATKTTLIDHLMTAHENTIEPAQEFDFKTESDFVSWKDTQEGETYSYFSKDCGRKGQRMYLYCQHDGSDRAHRKAGTPARLTARKHRIGQIKNGKLCISKMVVIVNEDDSRHVIYHPSHSHPLSKHDLAHQPPSAATNAFINNQLALNVPPREIHRKLQSTNSERENRDQIHHFDRNLVISERRIRQRAARKRNNLRLHEHDFTSVNLLVQTLRTEKYNPVVIYKPVAEGIVVGPDHDFDASSLKSLFMLGLQTKAQRDLMIEGAKRVLIVDDTHNVTMYDNVKLFNMLICDKNNHGWPVGHFISNCMGGKVIALFINAIKVRCAEHNLDLKINCVISDDDSALINGIEAGMGESIVHILCQWHLDKTFKGEIRLKVPLSLSDEIYTEMKVIIGERNVEDHKKLLEAFLKKHADDAEEFTKFISTYYIERAEKWAMCYRKSIGHGNINTTGHAESFHNTLKTGYFRRIPNKRMDDLCNTLLDLERSHFETRLRQEILGFSEAPHTSRVHHENGMAIPDDNITEVSSFMWTINSLSSKNVVYHIDRIEEFCSTDHCYVKCVNSSCHGLCAHLFVCSCPVKISLCKHIHKLQSFLLKDSPVAAAYEEPNSEVKFYSEASLNPASQRKNNAFSEANAYTKMESDITWLSEQIFKRSIPKLFLPSCSTTISDLVRKCAVLAISDPEQSAEGMPSTRKIAPKERLPTQFSQMLPYRKKKKKKNVESMKGDYVSRKEKRDGAKEGLLACLENDTILIEGNSGDDDKVAEEENKFQSPALTDIALVIGCHQVTFLDLMTLDLSLSPSDLERCLASNTCFEIGVLPAEIINSFIYLLAMTNSCVFAGDNELALSMATAVNADMSQGNVLNQLFGSKMKEKDVFIFPVNFSGVHWTLFAVLAKKCTILYMDPLNRKPTPLVHKCIDVLKRAMKCVKPAVLSWSVKLLSYRTQTDSINCGVHICWFAHQLITEVDTYDDILDIASYRSFIYNTLCGNCLKYSNDLNICLVCSSASPPDSNVGIRCAKCCRFFHSSCVGVTKEQLLNELFVCPEVE